MGGMKQANISDEEWREYVYNGVTYRIEQPEKLYISESGSHRVLDKNGIAHYMRDNWIVIRWESPKGVSF